MKRAFVLSLILMVSTSQVIADLEGWWRLDDGAGSSSAADASGNGRSGILKNMDSAIDWAPGKLGGCLDFDGANDYIKVSGYPGVTGSRSRSITAWVRIPAGTSGSCAIASWGNKDNILGSQWTFIVNNGILEVRTWGSYWPKGTGNVADGQWHHVGLVWENDGSANIRTIRFYIDGSLDPLSSSPSVTINTESEVELTIGSAINFGSATSKRWYFRGLMDDVRLYDRALTGEEINYIGQGFYPFASNPDPENDEVIQGDRVELKWLAGERTEYHDVYFGNDYEDVLNATSSSDEYQDRAADSSYTVNVQAGQSYYWRIDEVNESDIWPGHVWRFETAALVAYRPTPNLNTIEIDVGGRSILGKRGSGHLP